MQWLWQRGSFLKNNQNTKWATENVEICQMGEKKKKKNPISYKYQILLNRTFFLVSKPTVHVLLLWNTQTQTGTVSSLDKLESWSITMLSSSTIAGGSPRPVLFKGRIFFLPWRKYSYRSPMQPHLVQTRLLESPPEKAASPQSFWSWWLSPDSLRSALCVWKTLNSAWPT